MRLENKIIVITGGATGIGLAITRELLPHNTVISIDRNPAKITALKAALPQVVSLKADVTRPSELDAALLHIERDFGSIDLLINNAGTGSQFDFTTMPEGELAELLEREMAVNYKAPILLTRKAMPLLSKAAEPVVVFVSSGLAYMPIAGFAGYCASKSAMHVFTMSLRHQLRASKIRIVEVLPPTVDTDFNKGINAPKMSPTAFARAFITQLAKGKTVINIGQSAALALFSRFLPGVAFRMLNRGS